MSVSEGSLYIEPQTLKGFQDYLPSDVLARKAVATAVEGVFQKFGFVPLETPALESLDTLLGAGGEETNKELFRLQSPEDEPIALRFDLTVPFARLLAQYPDKLKTPFRRYAIGPVWRGDKPGPGRFREFTQLDADIAGADSVAADAEIISLMVEVMRTLGVSDCRALVNNRKLIDALLIGCGIVEVSRQKHVLRVIDKRAKVGLENVRLELGPGRVDDSGDPIPGVRLDTPIITKVLDFIGVQADTRRAVLAGLRQALPSSANAEKALEEMSLLADALEALGVSEGHAVFSPSLARGLDYYTGPVFEMVLPSAPEFGSVMGGGRYDGLVTRFVDRAVPCTGMSVGLDRLLAALQHLELLPERKTSVQVLVVTVGNVSTRESLKTATELRSAGICTEAYLGAKTSMKNQLSHADRYGIPVAVILGEDELASGMVSIKDLRAGKQQREHIQDREAYRQAGKTGQVIVPRSRLVETVQELLGQ